MEMMGSLGKKNQKKMKINFKKVLMIGVVGLVLIIIAEIFQIRFLRILGVFALAVVFVINSKMLLKRIEKLEKNGQRN